MRMVKELGRRRALKLFCSNGWIAWKVVNSLLLSPGQVEQRALVSSLWLVAFTLCPCQCTCGRVLLQGGNALALHSEPYLGVWSITQPTSPLKCRKGKTQSCHIWGAYSLWTQEVCLSSAVNQVKNFILFQQKTVVLCIVQLWPHIDVCYKLQISRREEKPCIKRLYNYLAHLLYWCLE